MRTSTLFGAKNVGVFEIYDVSGFPHGQGVEGLSQCGHFSGKKGGVNFSRLFVDVLYGRSQSNCHKLNLRRDCCSENFKEESSNLKIAALVFGLIFLHQSQHKLNL